MAKKSFVMLETWGVLFDNLSCENAGILIKAIYDYERGKDVEIEDPVLMSVYHMIRETLSENDEKYKETCEKRAKAGEQGGLSKSKQKKANANKRKQMLTNATKSKQTDPDNEDEYEDDNDNDDEDVNEDDIPGGDNKNLARSDPSDPSEPEADVELIPLNTGEGWRPKISQFEEYCRLYPNADVVDEFRKMRAWSLSNPTRRKTRSGVARFVNAWLSKAQNGRGRSPTQKIDWENV